MCHFFLSGSCQTKKKSTETDSHGCACRSCISWLCVYVDFFCMLPLKQSGDEWRTRSQLTKRAQHSKKKTGKKKELAVRTSFCMLSLLFQFISRAVLFFFFPFSLHTLWKVLVSVLFSVSAVAAIASFVDWCRFMFLLLCYKQRGKRNRDGTSETDTHIERGKRGKLKNWVVIHGKQIERSKAKWTEK